tara:strand:- start:447 stop:815 length:369 start_codon:yes stop_codon:yes gene_type:complete
MSISRYKETGVIFNNDPDFKQAFKERFGRKGLNELQRKKAIKHLETLELNYPNFDQMLNLGKEEYLWGPGDRFYKLADRFYGDARYWWIIAYFNKKPTDHHVKPGELILIPTPLADILQIIV